MTNNWNQVEEYCPTIGLRLPTEAQWEYAARGGSASARYGDIDAIAWYKGNRSGILHEVGLKQPNAFGLFDMLGNGSCELIGSGAETKRHKNVVCGVN